ncbi:MAG: hypothetical protein MRT15_09870, partial [archaeon YNP-LCB-003-016]|uniref:hypothetical protein n=1 Tax=Candidatus Culexarchaeum yellowstonense TaxID=2928963 RepID=UPI0026ED9483
MSLRVVGDMDVWKAVFDLLTSNTDKPIVRFTSDGLEAKNMDPNHMTLYDFRCFPEAFREYECPVEVYVKLDEYGLKGALKGARKGEVALWIDGEDLKFGGEIVGRVLKPGEAEFPSKPEFRYVNTVLLDAVLFRRFLMHSRRAGADYIRFAWDYEGRELNVAAVDSSWDVYIEIPKEHLIEPEIGATCSSTYSLPLIEQFLPPSAVKEKSVIEVNMTDADDMPIYVYARDFYPYYIEFKFWVAPQIFSSPPKVFKKTLPVKVAGGMLHYDDATLIFEHLYSNTDEPELYFREDGVEARNMDRYRTTYARLYASRYLFYEYSCVKPIYVSNFRNSRDRVKELIAISNLFKHDVEFTVREDNNVYYDKTVIGSVKERQEFKEPEVKIELKNMFEISSKDFIKMFRDVEKKVKAEREVSVRYFAIAYDSKWPRRAMLYFMDETGEVFEEVEVPEELVQWDVGRFMSGFDIDLVEQFFTSTLAKRDVKLRVSFDSYMPLKLETDFFTAYIAPNDIPIKRAVEKLGWIKPLTEDDIIDILIWKAHERVSRDEIENTLKRKFVDVEKLSEVLDKMIREGKVKRVEEGWTSYYTLPEAPTVLKPLTEEVILKTIKDLCDSWNTDAIGFNELKAVLGKEYQTEPLYDMLHRLEEKGLVESKPSPSKPSGPVRVDMRGYWALKTSKPEEAVKRAEEVKLKPLTKDVVLSVIEKLNDEVGENVKIDDVLRRLTDEGYDTAELSKFIDELKSDKAVTVTLDGRIVSSKYLEKVKPKPPPVPPGYVRVHFKRDMVRYIGMDRRYYGPFKSCEEAVIEKSFADAFKRHGYVE